MNGLLDRGAEVNSTGFVNSTWHGNVSRPSAGAGLAPPPQAPEAPSAPLCPRRGRTTAPPTAALALGRPRRQLLSLSALHCG